MISASEALEDNPLADAIAHVPPLDGALTVHAIAGNNDLKAVAELDSIDQGPALIRASNSWFVIVEEHAHGHSHDHSHASSHASD